MSTRAVATALRQLLGDAINICFPKLALLCELKNWKYSLLLRFIENTEMQLDVFFFFFLLYLGQ